MTPPDKPSSSRRPRDARAPRGGSAAVSLVEVSDGEETPPRGIEAGGEPPAAVTRAGDETARVELQERLSAYLSKGRPRIVVTDNVHTMVSIKRGDGVVTFRLHHMFLASPPAVLRALGRYAERQDPASARVLRAYIDTMEHRVRQREDPRPVNVDVEGKFHNVQTIFDRLNTEYFDGKIQARITWGPRSKRKSSRDSIKLGSYTLEDELIRIHPVLDAADVPTFFVEWIIYHEMLHEVHDMPVVDGRRVYHTPEFRRAEAQFEYYADAVLWERTHLLELLER